MGILRWPGGKVKLLKHFRCFLDDLLQSASSFHDPFVGGGSVLLDVARRYPDIPLFANDGDDSIAALWAVVSGPEREVTALVRLVEETTPSIDLWHEWKAAKPEDPVEMAFSLIFLSRTSHNGNLLAGIAGGKKQDRNKINGRYNPVHIVKQIRKARALLHGRLTVTCADGVDYVTSILSDDSQSVMYLDPPYVVKGSACYRKSMCWWDHLRLAEVLAHCDNWVLSYDDCRTVHNFYRWAFMHPISTTYSMTVATGPRPKGHELVILPRSHPHVRMLARLAGRSASA